MRQQDSQDSKNSSQNHGFNQNPSKNVEPLPESARPRKDGPGGEK